MRIKILLKIPVRLENKEPLGDEFFGSKASMGVMVVKPSPKHGKEYVTKYGSNPGVYAQLFCSTVI